MAIRFGTSGNDQLNGTDQNDLLFGASGDDKLEGKGGQDLLIGGRGNDEISGGDGEDFLFGNSGNDVLIGDKGNDTIIGGSGDDKLVWNNGDGSDRMRGGSGYDTTQVNGALELGDDFTLQGNQANQAIFNRNNLGQFTLTVDGVEKFEINGGGGDDKLEVKNLSKTEVQKVVFNGGDGNDVLDATKAKVSIYADGGAGEDKLYGSSKNDLISGGNDVDQLYGNQGNDKLIGDKGNDFIDGGKGDDLIIWNNGDGSDRMIGGKGYDTVQVNGALAAGDDFTLEGNQANQAIFNRNNLGLFTLTVDGTEKFEVNGGGGDDKFEVKDLSYTELKKVVFNGGEGNDVLDATEAQVSIYADGGAGDDKLYGSSKKDRLSGGDGVDELYGNGGKDVLIGDKGNDFIYGGKGNDLLIWNNGDGSDLMRGGQGYDTVQVNGATELGDRFRVRADGDKAIFQRVNLGQFALDIDEVEQLEVNGGGGDETFTIENLAPTDIKKVVFNGGTGDDRLNGQAARVRIDADGGEGHDVLLGSTKDDRLAGGQGNDSLTGGAGRDQFVFEGDSSFAQANLGSDRISDFQQGYDSIVLDKTVFSFLASAAGGDLDASEFELVQPGQSAAESDALISYNLGTGQVYYNANGSEAGFGDEGGLFATLENRPALTAQDFQVQV